MSVSWQIVEFAGRDGLRRIEADWRRLVARMPDRGPQHAYETHVAYFNHFCTPDEDVRCLVLTDGQQVRAICPTRAGSIRVLGRPASCAGLLCWKGALLLDVVCPAGEPERELLPRVVSYLRSSPSRPAWLAFDRVLEGSALWRCLGSLDPRWFCSREAPPTDVLSCTRTFEDVSAGLSRNFRGNLRKARNKLALLPNVRFETAERPPELERAFDVFVEVEASGWKGEDGSRSAMRFRPDQLGFHHELATRPWDGGSCQVNSLHADGACIASAVCLRVGSEYQIARIAYDERYARCAPGQLLVEKTLARCCEDPEIRCLNLASDAAWHRDWRPEAIPSHSVYVALAPRSGPLLVRLLRAQSRYMPRLKKALGRSGLGAFRARWRRGRSGQGPPNGTS